MTIPSSSLYPTAFDTDNNLFLVHDSLRVRLLEDYNPGDTSITIEGDPEVIARFPSTGCITLTEQCSDIEDRAISFYYGSRTTSTFDDLELLPDFPDVVKPKRNTNVTMNVMASHHNHLKNALIAIETFAGVEGTTDIRPGGDTLEGRTNYLRNLVLSPRAWFSADKRIGVAPIEICFTDESFRSPTGWLWNFGDGSPNSACSVSGISGICSTSLSVPSGISMAVDLDGNRICKTYYCPGMYDVTLTVTNDFGADTITIPEYITIRAPAPDEATMVISPAKVTTDTLVNVEVTDNGEQPTDLVTSYTWNLSDDLPHANTAQTVASYSVGGLYDVKLRVDTELGAYRITVLEDAINVVERTNLWFLAFDSAKSNLATTKTATTYEFGLVSQTFKTTSMPTLSVTRNDSFMSSYTELAYQREIFRRNNSFAPRGSTGSGDRGKATIYWAEDQATVRFRQFEPFDEVWTTPSIGGGGSSLGKNWNWAALNSSADMYLVFGPDSISDMPTNVSQVKNKISLNTYASTNGLFTAANYSNGADELMTNPDDFPSTYRTAFKGNNGFVARNDAGPGGFFRIKSFYRTSGVLNDLVQNFLKLSDIPGSARTECELVTLQSGIYVFNNTGEVSAFNTTTNTWSTGGPGVGSASFRALQDSAVDGYSEASQPLRAASDGDRRAYLSFDYSEKAFVQFNEVDLTFTGLTARPTGNEQFIVGVY